MKKILIFLLAVLGLFSLTCCATTSGVSKDVKVKENKLTRLSYVKKICQITDAYECEDLVAYELDNGKGRFVHDKKNKVKVCLIVRNGELYGRYSQVSKHGAVLAQSYHNDKCSSMSSIQNGYMYFYTPNQYTASGIKAEMDRLARKWGLILSTEAAHAMGIQGPGLKDGSFGSPWPGN